jgi:hypothetical protein
MDMKRVMLHINRLVLRGIDRADAQAVSAGLQAELQALLADPRVAGALVNGGNRARVHAGTVDSSADGSGRNMGKAIAGGIARGIAGSNIRSVPS